MKKQHPNPMKFCPECHKRMVMTNTYVKFCHEIDEIITVNSSEPFLSCPDGCVAHIPGAVYLDGYRLQIQRRIEEWILSNVKSFEDFSRTFFTKRQALAYICRQSKIVSCDDQRFNPRVIKNVLDWYCFHARICGQNFYLKKSIEKYCQTSCGWFPLSEGF
jgi:hypothetical protein